jgi:CDP-glycerol glycerophosphotransferase (TagB/SpsB family)
MLKKIFWLLVNQTNKILPKLNRVVIIPFPNIESGALELANYLGSETDMEVIFVVSSKQMTTPRLLLLESVNLVTSDGGVMNTVVYIFKVLTSKYVFFTHSLFLNTLTRQQIVINLWHGLLYKKLGKLIGGSDVVADITVGCSDLSKQMFSDAFGVPIESVSTSGYPRNDILLKSKRDKVRIKSTSLKSYDGFEKIVIWLPTYRQNANKMVLQDGVEAGNPFYIPGFDVGRFNGLLKEHNAICFIKPHPLAVVYPEFTNLSNLEFIDDKWLLNVQLSLYQLVGCSDILISDVSSIIIDYLLLDQPIVCMSMDIEEYKSSRGFYFDDIQNWLPNSFSSETEFVVYLGKILSGDEDPFKVKRQCLKQKFFLHHDAFSTSRLVKHVLNHKKPNS